MRDEELSIRDIFPDKEELIALGSSHDEFFGKVVGDNTFLMIMNTLTIWSPQYFPAPLPGVVAHIGIFPVERLE